MKRSLLSVLFLFAAAASFAQTYNIGTLSGTTQNTCSGTFVDNGGSGGNYTANSNNTITFCPSTPGDKIRVSFTSFDTQGTATTCNDFLEVWYASTAAGAPSDQFCGNRGAFNLVSTSPDGCITFRFTSDGNQQRSGWSANITCVTPCTPPTSSLVNSAPVYICPSTSLNPGSLTVAFDASSSTAAAGSSISSYEWQWGDGSGTTTTATPTTTHTFPNSGVYTVKLFVRDNNTDTDPLGCRSTNSTTRVVYVTPAPNFTGSSNTTVNLSCNQSTTLTGVAASQTATTTVPSIVAATTSLPDGGGESYSSTLDFSGLFPPGATITPACYPTVSFNLEHSYSGDLQIELIAPSGQAVTLFNRTGTSTHFGTCSKGADDGVAGCGATYTVVASGGNTWGAAGTTVATPLANGNCTYTGVCETANYYRPLSYNSASSFAGFNGAAMNGVWTIRITDHLDLDDGTLFSWSLTFPTGCYDQLQSVTPDMSTAVWSHSGSGPAVPAQTTTSAAVTDPGPGACPTAGTCLGNRLTNAVTVGPFNVGGAFNYNFTVTDEFGCRYLRTVTVNVTCPPCDAASTPVATATPNGQTLCSGATTGIALTSNLANTAFTWSVNQSGVTGASAGSFPFGSGGTIAQTLTTTGTAPGTATYTITPTTASCPGTPIVVTVTVNPIPAVLNNPPFKTICSGENTNIALSSDVTGATFNYTASVTSGTITGFTASANGVTSINQVLTNTGAAAGVVRYVITPVANGCPGAPLNYDVTVNPTPVVTNNPLNKAICSGDNTSITLTSNVAGTTFDYTASVTAGTVTGFTATATGVTAISDVLSNTTTSAGTVTYVITPVANGCPGTPVNYLVTVNPIPSIAALPNITACSNDAVPAVTLTSTPAGATFTWTNSNTAIGLAANGTGNVPAFTATNTTASGITGVVSVTPTLNGCTGAAVTYTITVNPTPTVTVTANISACHNDPVAATAFTSNPAGATFSWTNSAASIGLAASGTGDLPAFTATNTTTATVTATVTVTPSLNGCTGAPSSFTITVRPSPTVTVPASFAVCRGAGVTGTTFSSSPGGATYAWTNSNTAIGLIASGTGNLPSFTSTNTTGAPISGTITVVPSLGGCTGPAATYTITVNPVPTVTVPSSFAVCRGDAVPASSFTTVPAGASIAWTNSNTAIGVAANGTGNIPAFTAANATTSPITATISVTASASGCTSPASTYTITVNPVPNVTIPASFAVCHNAGVTATTFSSTTPGTTYAWTNSNTAIGVGAGGAGNVPSFTATNTSTAPISGVITVTPTANGCSGTPVSYTITVNPVPTVTVPASFAVCNNGSVNATSFTSTPAGATYTWTSSNPAIGTAANGTGNIPTFTAVNTGTTSITSTITVVPASNGCTGPAATYTITVRPTPAATVPASFSVCNNQAVAAANLTSVPAGATFAWTNSVPAIGLAGSGTGNVSGFTAVNNAGGPINATISVTPTVNGCVGTASTYTITVNPNDNASFSYAASTFCITGTDATPTITGVPGGTFSSAPAGLTLNATSGVITVATSALGSYTVTYTTNGTCPNTSTVNVTITDAPDATFSYNGPYCQGSTPNATPVFAAGASAGVFSSSPALVFVSTSTGEINLGASAPGTYTVTNTIASAGGCAAATHSTTVIIRPVPVVNTIPAITECPGTAIPVTTFASTPAGATFTWTNSNTATGLGANGTGNLPAFTAAANNTGSNITGTVTVTPALNGCTGAPATFTITVKPTPVAAPVSNVIACNNDNVAATALTSTPGGATFAWTNSNTAIGLGASGTGDVTAFTATNATGAAITGTVSIVPTLNGCAGPAITYTVTVNPTPTVTVPASFDVCNNDAVPATNLTSAPAGATYTWTNSVPAIGLAANGTGNIPAFTAVNNAGGPINATITVIPTVNGCAGAPTTYTITVNPTPAATVPESFAVCNNDAVAAASFTSAPSGATYAWTNSNPSIGLPANGTGNVPAFTATNAGTTPITATISVIPTVDGCDGPAATYTITVNPTPSATVPASFAVCNNDAVAATSFTSTPAGATFAWVNSNTSIGLAAAGSGNVPAFTATNNTTAPITATISVIPTLDGCVGPVSTYTITVNPTPTVTAPASFSVCNTEAVPATTLSSTPAGASYTWTNSNTAIGLAASGTGDVSAFTATNTTTAPITATITVTPSVNGCTGIASSYVITVNPTPTVTVPASFAVCNTEAVPATSFTSTPAGATYAWTNSNSAIGLPASGTGNVPSFTATNTTGAPITATISVIPTVNGCEGPASTYTITVNPTPTVTVPVSFTVCNTDAVAATSFTSVPSGATYEWTNSNTAIGLGANGTGDAPAFTAANTTTAPITATITVTPTVNGCIGTPSSYTITVNQTDNASFTYGGSTFCVTGTNGTATITGLPGGTFTSSPAGLSLDSSTGEIAVATSTLGNYTVTYTTNGPCPNSSTVNVVITDSPDATFSYSGPYCHEGAPNPVPVFPSGASAGFFTSTTGLVFVNTSTGEIDLTASTPGTYTVTNTIVAQGGCASAVVTNTVTINPLPTANQVQTITECPGATIPSIQFTSNPPNATYTWTNSSTLTGLSANGSGDIPSFTAAANNSGSFLLSTITVTPTLNGCDGDPMMFDIIIKPTPVAIDPADITVCPEQPVAGVTFNSIPAGAVFTWTNSNTAIGLGASGSGDMPAFISTANNSGANITGTISITPTLNGCAGAPVDYIITVKPLDDPGFSYPGSTFCQTGNDAVPTVTGVTGGTFTAAPSGLVINASTGVISVATSALNTYTVTYTTPSTANACPHDTSVVITITDAPDATFSYAASYCEGSTPNPVPEYPAGASAGVFSAAPSGLVFTNTSTGEIDMAATAPGTYTVTNTIVAAGGCAPASATFTVTINPLPSVDQVSGVSYCPAAITGAIEFSSTPSGASFTWTNTNTAIGLGASGSGNVPSFTAGANTTTGPITGTIAVTSTLNGCQGDTMYFDITVKPLPVAAFTASQLGTCAPVYANYTDQSSLTGGTITAWQWNFGVGGTSAAQNPDSVYYEDPGSYNATLTVTGSNGCSNTIIQQAVVNVSGYPVASFEYSPTPADILNPKICFTDRSTGAVSWEWDFADPLDAAGSLLQDPCYTYSDTGTFCARLVVANMAGCTDTTYNCVVISPSVTVYIPNAFSPNGDQLNDDFGAMGMYIKEYEMYIFDRWGNNLFHSTKLEDRWDGRANGGSEIAQEDVYVYVIFITTTDDKKLPKKVGHVTLIK